LPRLNSFARYDWNSPTGLYAGDRNWTVGVMASWSLFAGANEMADMKATAARAAAAGAQAEAATANARLEAEQTRTALAVALKRLDIAERAVTQSAEAHRIVGRKYEGGLATVVELLDAQAVETQSALSLSQARWSAIAAAAERRRALGLDPATLAALDDTATVAAHASLDGR
jgi:outer membrane protein TolC